MLKGNPSCLVFLPSFSQILGLARNVTAHSFPSLAFASSEILPQGQIFTEIKPTPTGMLLHLTSMDHIHIPLPISEEGVF